jgi:membrane protein implicated in regulation of membrane protease activity
MYAIQVQLPANIVPLIITGGVVLLVLALVQLYLGLKVQKSPKVTGEKAMIGETGIIRESSGFRSRAIVETRGELWWCLPACGATPLEVGDTVKITGIAEDTMILEVESV